MSPMRKIKKNDARIKAIGVAFNRNHLAFQSQETTQFKDNNNPPILIPKLDTGIEHIIMSSAKR